MIQSVSHTGGCRRAIAISVVFLWALSACHSAPIVDRPPAKPGQTASAAENPKAPPPLSADDRPSVPSIDVPIETPIEPPIVVPPCLPPEPAPQPKHRPRHRSEPQAPTAPSSAAGTAVTPPGEIDAEVKSLDDSVASVLGKKVYGAKGEDLGRVVDVLADSSGRVRVAVIEFGGFLGVGNRRIPVDWSLLRFHPDDQDEPLTLSVSRKKLQSAPEYKNSNHPQALMAPQIPAVAPTPSAAEGKK
jgi:sporulation protein YlmC with PRC-barrel domain